MRYKVLITNILKPKKQTLITFYFHSKTYFGMVFESYDNMSKKVLFSLIVIGVFIYNNQLAGVGKNQIPLIPHSVVDTADVDSLLTDTVQLDSNKTIENTEIKQALKGTASYYHDKFVGRTTANGDVYSQKGFTAAHRTLPLGTMVRVTNLKNNKSVEVLINDRMGKSRHEIDLTKAAAMQIGMIQSGWAKVKIEVL